MNQSQKKIFKTIFLILLSVFSYFILIFHSTGGIKGNTIFLNSITYFQTACISLVVLFGLLIYSFKQLNGKGVKSFIFSLISFLIILPVALFARSVDLSRNSYHAGQRFKYGNSNYGMITEQVGAFKPRHWYYFTEQIENRLILRKYHVIESYGSAGHRITPKVMFEGYDNKGLILPVDLKDKNIPLVTSDGIFIDLVAGDVPFFAYDLNHQRIVEELNPFVLFESPADLSKYKSYVADYIKQYKRAGGLPDDNLSKELLQKVSQGKDEQLRQFARDLLDLLDQEQLKWQNRNTPSKSKDKSVPVIIENRGDKFYIPEQPSSTKKDITW